MSRLYCIFIGPCFRPDGTVSYTCFLCCTVNE